MIQKIGSIVGIIVGIVTIFGVLGSIFGFLRSGQIVELLGGIPFYSVESHDIITCTSSCARSLWATRESMVQGSFCRRAELMPYAELSGLHNFWDTGGTSSGSLNE